MRALTPALTVLVLAAVAALGPLATDMYLPALPAIGQALGAGADEVQLTLSVYMAGFALAQLFCGPLSDRLGRKPLLIGGLAIFSLASLLCALAPTIEILLAGRFLQALGGATGPVLGRAAVRDLYQPRDAGRILSYMASIMALAPALAPLGGGLLLLAYGWEAVFVFLALYGGLMILVIAWRLPEPLAPENRQSIRPDAILANFRLLIADRRFLGYTLTNAAAYSGLFAFLSGSAFVLIDYLGVSPIRYGLLFALVVAGFFTGTLTGGQLSRVLGTDRLIVAGALLCAGSGCAMAALALGGVHTVTAIILPQAVFLAGVGILMPQTMAGAIAPFPRFAGSASSLFGFLQMTTAAITGALVGQLHDGSSRTMAVAVAMAGLMALVGYLTLVRSPRPDKNAPPASAQR
ncbi:MAG: multidrug effflux MFS transporter [Ectothiorhodospiraceae bacterium]|nr:multidrug effflux MFS transporter [Ectothiorhodospiraceae bacterium]MCH8504576.1 multidrug effflux MFS transporter [Ectothiorhodospiraceae bacterium]